VTALETLRQQLGEAIWEARLAEARAREEAVRNVLAALSSGASFAAAAREHAPQVGVTAVKKWVGRWQAEGLAGLVERRAGAPRAPAEPSVQLSLGAVLHVVHDAPGQRRPRDARGRRAGLLKWSGSKEAVVDQLVAMAPAELGRYHEPFLGGGSLFFALRPKVSFLADTNAELINLYRVVRDEPEPLLDALARHRNTREHFTQVRGLHPDALPPVERAARTLFLNRTCFNGIYRVNSKGIFNVPYGNMPHQGFFVPDAIARAHRSLAGAELSCEDFERCGERARPGDFVYLDPPYPSGLRGEASGLLEYQAGGFSEDDQRRVAALVRRLDQRGVRFMLSNSDCELTRELFTGFCIDTLAVRRNVGGHAGRRGMAREIVVRNYTRARDTLPLLAAP
jgi:DNA adenine methylase